MIPQTKTNTLMEHSAISEPTTVLNQLDSLGQKDLAIQTMKKAPQKITEEFVKTSVIKFLTNKGWSKNLQYGSLKTHGVDIKVTNAKYSRPFFIETKGASGTKSSFENAFIHSLGQIATRMQSPKARYYYGLALPKMSADIAMRRVSYQFAIGMCLHVFSVADDSEVIWFKPKDFKKM